MYVCTCVYIYIYIYIFKALPRTPPGLVLGRIASAQWREHSCMYTYTTLASHRLLRIYRTRFQEQHFEARCDQIKQEIFSIGKGSISDRIIFGPFSSFGCENSCRNQRQEKASNIPLPWCQTEPWWGPNWPMRHQNGAKIVPRGGPNGPRRSQNGHEEI